MSTNTTVNIGNQKATLPILIGQSNFRRWYKSWHIALRGAKLWSVVNDGDNKESLPVKLENETNEAFKQRLDNYNDRNDVAHSALLGGVSEDLQELVCSCDEEPESARVAMRLLKEKFDYETMTSTIQLFKEFSELKMEEGESVSQHISRFETAYAHIYSRCANSSRPEATALRSFLSVEQVKVMYLFFSLPTSFNNIIDNLTTKDDLRFADVSRRLLDLNAMKLLDIPSSSKAYFGNERSNSDNKTLECTYCKKHGVNYKGHVYNKCRKLQVHLDQRSKNKGKSVPRFNKANVVLVPDEEFSDVISSTTTHDKAFLSSSTNLTSSWILDSGCSAHMTSHKELLSSLHPHKGVVTIANGQQISVEGKGNLCLNLQTSTGGKIPVTIPNVLYVPELKGGNLISESQLELDGNVIISQNGRRRVFFKEKEWMFAVLDSSKQFVVQEDKYKALFTSYREAHECFGHPGESVMSNLRQKYPDQIPNKPQEFHCPACALSKSTHKSEHSKQRKSSKPFQIIYSDLSGKFSVDSLGKKGYYITFIDDYSRYPWISFIRVKSDAYQAIRDFVIRIQNQNNLTIKTFFSDNGGEYIDGRVQKFFTDNGIDHENSPPYEHESNGTAEIFNRTIVTKARAMLLDLPKFLWAEAIATSVSLYNRTPYRTIDFKSPFELLHGTIPPSITHLHAFGTKVYVHIPVETRPSGSKLQPRAIEGIFVGYTNSSNIFRIFIPSKSCSNYSTSYLPGC
ncbi:hypothetical protein K3495_g9431 [Podosphaera aphanis]|nr:hypothetical protein K3495_g9431 [Podosphaera aphanis]